MLGKPRTKLGNFLDLRGISQEWLVKKTKVSRNTISKLSSDETYSPTLATVKKVMAAIREVDPTARPEDFFDI
ncbi:helix-turn-helix domain-containing protein [Cytobacillus oceanisediminis]|uniref:helix-turn-helix domain-containing protein n=1 Tax=Cytobacillus oceanisediminis TaxID=665099 RepID=UPI002550B1A4|nr:helix-turn-helix transcriptional regulator [Cytobacillus oceanisediminis]MDK7669535.1 helix-turn-helix transcriptional regulator [Cytobacillus oceanisediminis]